MEGKLSQNFTALSTSQLNAQEQELKDGAGLPSFTAEDLAFSADFAFRSPNLSDHGIGEYAASQMSDSGPICWNAPFQDSVG